MDKLNLEPHKMSALCKELAVYHSKEKNKQMHRCVEYLKTLENTMFRVTSYDASSKEWCDLDPAVRAEKQLSSIRKHSRVLNRRAEQILSIAAMTMEKHRSIVSELAIKPLPVTQRHPEVHTINVDNLETRFSLYKELLDMEMDKIEQHLDELHKRCLVAEAEHLIIEEIMFGNLIKAPPMKCDLDDPDKTPSKQNQSDSEKTPTKKELLSYNPMYNCESDKAFIKREETNDVEKSSTKSDYFQCVVDVLKNKEVDMNAIGNKDPRALCGTPRKESSLLADAAQPKNVRSHVINNISSKNPVQGKKTLHKKEKLKLDAEFVSLLTLCQVYGVERRIVPDLKADDIPILTNYKLAPKIERMDTVKASDHY